MGITQSVRKKKFSKEFSKFLICSKRDFKLKWNNAIKKCNVTLDDFERIKTLGTGTFGTVILVSKKNTDTQFAMKILDKETIVQLKQIEHTVDEKRILAAVDFKFIVKLHYHFKDNSYLYLVMEYVSGGEIFTYVKKYGRFSENFSRFYVAQVVLAFEYLHNLNIMYRDMKPENVLLSDTGYIKITDFGFAKVVMDKTWTLCGTPEYLAPEIILSKGYNKAVDWYSLGIFIYEITCGYPPFKAVQPIEVYRKILLGKVSFRDFISSDLQDLITNLLHSNVTERLGNLRNGVTDIKNHKWFSSKFDWMGIYRQQIAPPLLPDVKQKDDTSNFAHYDEQDFAISSVEKYGEEFEEF